MFCAFGDSMSDETAGNAGPNSEESELNSSADQDAKASAGDIAPDSNSPDNSDGGGSETIQHGEALTFTQTATWGGIFPITALNALLNIVTLTLWRFWGRTRVRRYLWSSTQINGTPLEYTGSGWELFRSFVFVMLIIFLPISAAIFAGQMMMPPEQFAIIFAVSYIPILFGFYWLMGIATWAARRYRLSRTTWRGIRFGQAGSANGFAWATIGYGLLTGISMGWYEPAKEMRLSRRLWGETFYGDQNFEITHSDEGLAGPLYGSFALSWFSGIIGYFVFIGVYLSMIGPELEAGNTNIDMDLVMLGKLYAAMFVFMIIVGVMSMPYQAALIRRKAQIIGLGNLRFNVKVTSWGLGWVFLGNLLILIVTLGFGLPFAQMRLWRYIFQRIEADGEIDIDQIRQTADRGPKSGEGLADAFDIGNVI
jgi:uncharacterized membrane protein YjgN (DUF898 family)